MGDFDNKKALDELYKKRVVNNKTGGSFAILRTAKITSMGNMSGSLQHTFRERETLNADSDRIRDNQILIGPDNSKEILQSWHDRAPDKIRKNAVRGIEYLVTGSPEAMAKMSREQQDAYFAKSVEWLKEKHGEENILSAVVHRDETTPHLSAMIIPIDERGKLNAREFLGGRDKLSQMQTDFAERVGQEHGLERGVQGTKSKHKTIKSYYADLEQLPKVATKLPERAKSGFMGRSKETDEEYTQRASEALKTALSTERGHFTRKIDQLELARDQNLSIAGHYKALSETAIESAERIIEARLGERDKAHNAEAEELEKRVDSLALLYDIERGVSHLEKMGLLNAGKDPEIKQELEQEAKTTGEKIIKLFPRLNKSDHTKELFQDIYERLKDAGWERYGISAKMIEQSQNRAEEQIQSRSGKTKSEPSRDRDTGPER